MLEPLFTLLSPLPLYCILLSYLSSFSSLFLLSSPPLLSPVLCILFLWMVLTQVVLVFWKRHKEGEHLLKYLGEIRI